MVADIFTASAKYFNDIAKKLEEPPSIVINSELIERVKQAKYLGVILDDRLKFHAHIDWVIAKVAKKCGVISRLAKDLDFFWESLSL